MRVLICLLLCAAVMLPQSATTGALEGTVTNDAGGPLADVAVILLDHATGQKHAATSNEKGSYQFSLLPPGTYEVVFSRTGYQTAYMPQMTVSVSERPLLESALEPGDPAERMPCLCKVSASAPSTGTLVDQKTITAVPLNTRNFTQVLSMSSGSAADVNNAGTLGRGTQSVNVNGNSSAGGYTIDGAHAPSTVPNPDSISEFKIQTSQYDAMFGAMAPSTNLLTRSGQNEYHGNLWEFLRNDVFNANTFFRNRTWQPNPNLKQNHFGATFGGPVKRNRLFFFGSWQGTRQVNGLDPTSVANLILPPLGNDRSAATIARQFCPANGGSSYLTFAGGKQLDCGNANTATTASIHPVALRLLQAKSADGEWLIPVPQMLLPSGLGFSSYSLPSTYKENHFIGNADYVIGANHTLSGRVFGATVDQLRTFGSPGGYPGAPVVPGWGAPQALDAADVATSVKLTSTLSANTVNETTMAFTRNRTDAVGVNIPEASMFGITPVDPLFPKPPEITILGPQGTFRLFGTNPNDNHFQTVTYSWADNLSVIRGAHRIRMGGSFLTQYNGRADTGGARGRISFQTFSDFLLGMSAAENQSPYGRSNIQVVQANEGAGPQGEVEYRYRRYYGAGFIQDDWKLTPRLTLNAGMRWEYIGPSFDTAGTIGNVSLELMRQAAMPPAAGTFVGSTVAANYNPDMVNPYTGKPFGPPPAGVTIRSSKSFYDNGTPLDRFAPRVGLAWQPTGSSGRFVLGAGYGWFYQAPAFSGNASSSPLFTSAPFAQGFTNADASNGLSTFQQPFPVTTLGFIARTPTSQLSDRVAASEYRIPRLQQWNATAKLKIAGTVSADVGYVGSRGSNLLLARGMNQPLLAAPGAPVNCGYDGVASHCIETNTSLNARQRVPILGETPTALTTSEFTGASWYHSLQTTLRMQRSHGLSFQAAYTLSRAESNTAVFNDQNTLERARTGFDRRHRVIGNFDYQLPALRLFGGLPRFLADGWSVAGIVIVQSGLPLTLTDPNGGSVYGRAGTPTVTLCPGVSANALSTEGSVSDRLYQWIDSTTLCNPAIVGTDGATAYGTAPQSIMAGPGQVNTDFSIGKRTKVGGIREDSELAFRVEFYNALNHPQFANPGTTFRTASFGAVTGTSVAPRLIQFGLKYIF